MAADFGLIRAYLARKRYTFGAARSARFFVGEQGFLRVQPPNPAAVQSTNRGPIDLLDAVRDGCCVLMLAMNSLNRTTLRHREWALMRAHGRTRYIWVYGVLRWGGFMYLFSMVVYHYSRFGSVFSAEGHPWFRAVLGAAVWTYVGYLYGRSCWNRNERAFRTSDSTDAVGPK